MKNKCRRDLAESERNTIRMRNEATANSQLRAGDRSSQSDICGTRQEKSSLDKRGLTVGDRGMRRKVGRSLLQKTKHSSIPQAHTCVRLRVHTHTAHESTPSQADALIRKKDTNWKWGTMSRLSCHKSAYTYRQKPT